MHCPFCQHSDTRVIDSRVSEDGATIRRRRECEACGERFSTLEAVELGQFRAMLGKASLKGIYFQGWAALINPSVELVILTCGHVDNSSGYCNPDYDKLVKQAAATLDDAKRKPIEMAAQKIIWEDAPWLYLWRLPNYYGVSNRVDYKFRADNYFEPYLVKFK